MLPSVSSLFQVLFPVNRLRNLAKRQVRTKYILLIDADFVPNENLQEDVKEQIQNGFFREEGRVRMLLPIPQISPHLEALT